MPPYAFLLGLLLVWAACRLFIGQVLPFAATRLPETVTVELEWWRITCRHHNEDSSSAFGAQLTAAQRAAVRQWFNVGLVVGLLAAVCSILLLWKELYMLLAALWQPPAVGSRSAADPLIKLTLPGVTLPLSHAGPLWLALAISLAVHEVSLLDHPVYHSVSLDMAVHLHVC
jgi:hypothetical protein